MRRFSRAVITLALLPMALLYQSCAKEDVVYRKTPIPSLEREITDVRVLVVENAGEIEISSEYVIAGGVGAGSNLGGYGGSGILKARGSGGQVCLEDKGKQVLRSHRVMLKPRGGGYIEINGTGYRGRILLTAEGGSGISAVNYIGIDDYLRGVLPSEIGYLKGRCTAAYRAQALASRSYALSKLHETRRRYFDLRATIMDQVYRGVSGEYPPATRAVNDTRGKVITWKGRPARTYYSSCCGGHTADIRSNWPWKKPFHFLRGVRDSGAGKTSSFCRGSRHFRWRVRWSGDRLAEILRRTLPDLCEDDVKPFQRILDIRQGEHSRDGRIKSLTFITDSGSYMVRGDRIRWVLRPESASGPILKSTLLKLEIVKKNGAVRELNVLGGGNGHGVGLCQSGAIEMSREGYSAEEIVKHYYPGVNINRYY
ncbi:MAG: SpoIID/LytB domain-containing protein [Candidatus Latescibacteria bacterium]|nr:SpoIID/LytB domain-containing protein [bacterium]MBD3424847.1 SpoIID/LytB domain-containing protein [Candidatus Latescibacterota bacterium]